MNKSKGLRCAIYTRVSTDAGLEQDFNSLDAQREASEAYIKSQAHEGWSLIKTPYDDGGFSGGSMDRPALQKLLDDVRSGLVDIIVVYKVDRLTRSLADFAKLVELFDAHNVSFVSVTQSFNTTTSMGRLTLNVLLSFAQFEREVTGERIRDKIAASKKKGIWMGGSVPLGYRVQDRKLIIIPEDAATVRLIFERYLELGSTISLLEDLNAKKIVTKRRVISDGRIIGGIPFTLGPLTYLLKNRIYIGEVVHKGAIYLGEHEAILDRNLFDAVQAKLRENLVRFRAKQAASNALLIGKLFDDAGNAMTPTHCSKKGIRYRYYTSRAFIDGRKQEAGSIARIAADDVEGKVAEGLKGHRGIAEWAREQSERDKADSVEVSAQLSKHVSSNKGLTAPDTQRDTISLAISRIDIRGDHLLLTLTETAAEIADQPTLSIPWSPRPKRPRRELIVPINSTTTDLRPMHAERRAKQLRAIAIGRKWLRELVEGKSVDVEEIAKREGRSARSVQMMISLAFVAPNLVEAAIDGRLSRGMGITRLADLPPSWRQQREVLGLIP
jgi:DNA invertase Pin-like site-specific DNA recombinase